MTTLDIATIFCSPMKITHCSKRENVEFGAKAGLEPTSSLPYHYSAWRHQL